MARIVALITGAIVFAGGLGAALAAHPPAPPGQDPCSHGGDCPSTTETLKALERRLPDRERDSVTFALFSLDPGRDTPEALQRFAADHKLDRGRWRLFAAPEDGVRSLAAMLGVKYASEPSGAIAHSATVVVIGPEGAVRHRQVGLSADSSELLRAVAAAR